MVEGTLSQLDEEQLRLEAELESVRRELEAYNNAAPVAINSRTSSGHHHHLLHHPLQHRHSDSILYDTNDYSRRRITPKQKEYNHGNFSGENPFYGAHMMQMLLEQQARVFSKESEMLQKEIDRLKVNNYFEY